MKKSTELTGKYLVPGLLVEIGLLFLVFYVASFLAWWSIPAMVSIVLNMCLLWSIIGSVAEGINKLAEIEKANDENAD